MSDEDDDVDLTNQPTTSTNDLNSDRNVIRNWSHDKSQNIKTETQKRRSNSSFNSSQNTSQNSLNNSSQKSNTKKTKAAQKETTLAEPDDGYSINHLIDFAERKIFPQRTFLLMGNKKLETPVTLLLSSQTRFEEKPETVLFVCKDCKG